LLPALRPGRFTPRKRPAPIAQEVRLFSAPVWMGPEILTPNEITAQTDKTVNIFMHIYEKVITDYSRKNKHSANYVQKMGQTYSMYF
jgi:hypothetical protein